MGGDCTVVTGAASGIGFAVACKVLAGGGKVVAVDLNADRLAERFGGNADVVPVACDLLTDAGFDVLTKSVKDHFDSVVGFVHAAGFDMVAPLGLVRQDDVNRLVSIHAGFPIRFLAWMSKKANHAANAACVLISSLSAHEGAKSHVAYAAAKGAVEGFLKSAAAELVSKGIRVNAVVLGVVNTEMARGWMGKLLPEQLDAIKVGYPLGLGDPHAVADVIAFFLGAQSRWITGQTLICDGGHSLT